MKNGGGGVHTLYRERRLHGKGNLQLKEKARVFNNGEGINIYFFFECGGRKGGGREGVGEELDGTLKSFLN